MKGETLYPGDPGNNLLLDQTFAPIREELTTWLGDEYANNTQLVQWLRGFDLPAGIEVEYDPGEVLWNALPRDDSRDALEVTLAQRARSLLQLKPDDLTGEFYSQYPDRYANEPHQLYSLLILCSELKYPAILGEPLFDMLERVRENPSWLTSRMGTWYSGAIVGGLRNALIWNQIDDRLEPEWEAMLAGQTPSYLPGNAVDGAQGLVWIPGDQPGQPNFRTIGKALAGFAQHLEKERLGERLNVGLDEKKLLGHFIDVTLNERFPRLFDQPELRVAITNAGNLPPWARDVLFPQTI